MQTNSFKNLIINLYYANSNNNIKHYYIKKHNKIKHITKAIKHNNTMYNNYFNVFNSNKQNMCFNTKCKNCKNCIYAQLKIAYKHITNNTYNNMLLLKYLQFYSNTNYKYVNKYKIKSNLYFLTTKLHTCTCNNFIN